jgi:hypothetical protein
LERDSEKKDYSCFLCRRKPIIPRAPSAESGHRGVYKDGVTGRRGAETVLVFPAATRMLVE